MAMLTTTQLCEKLGVDRRWVINHLRDLGVKSTIKIDGKPSKVVVLYDEDKIIRWLNDNARFTRQTMQLDLCKFSPEHIVAAEWNRLSSMPRRTEAELDAFDKEFRGMVSRLISDEAVDYCMLLSVRERGLIPWVPVGHRISSMDELFTMKHLMEQIHATSTELVYRDIYRASMIRCAIKGHTWFIPAPEKPQYSILMPATFK